MATCEHGPQLSAYHDGELPESHRSTLDAHLSQCLACQAELREIQTLSQALHSAQLPALPAEARERLTIAGHYAPRRGALRAVRAFMAIAAVIFLVAAGSLMIQIKQAARGPAPVNGTPVSLTDEHSPMHFVHWILDELRGK